jgi:hypothetical protein
MVVFLADLNVTYISGNEIKNVSKKKPTDYSFIPDTHENSYANSLISSVSPLIAIKLVIKVGHPP